MNILNRIKQHFKKSPMDSWVEREIALAIEKERKYEREDAEKHGKKYNPEDWSYGVAIYESAMRAYKSLLKDGHSGMSWGITTQVLMRLMKHRPLTPLRGTDDEWKDCSHHIDGEVMYQNIRCSAVFKHVDSAGNVTYSDNDRVVCVDEGTGHAHNLGLASMEVNERFPITFPYSPSNKPYKVYDRAFATTGEPGCYDTVGVFKIECPNGTTVEVNKYYKEDGDRFVPIDKHEYQERLGTYYANRRNNEPRHESLAEDLCDNGDG